MGGINSNVVALFHCDGVVGTSVLVNAHYSTAIVPSVKLASIAASGKFGNCLLWQGNSNQIITISALGVLSFGSTTPFTIDFWGKMTTSLAATAASIYNIWEYTNVGGTSMMQWNVQGLTVGSGGPHRMACIIGYATSLTLSANEWIHYALCRTSTDYYLAFVNGSKVYSAFGSGFKWEQSTTHVNYLGGRYWPVWPWVGMWDEFRITRGVCLWTEDFTPPTERYTYDLPTSEIDLVPSVNYPRIVTSTSLEYANKFRSDVIRKGIDLSADVIRGCLMSAGFAFDRDAHHYWSEIADYAASAQQLSTVEGSLWPYTVLLLHGDGSDGGSIFTDSAKGKSITRGGAAALITASATKKFGTGAIKPSTVSTVDFLSLAYHSDFCLGSVFTMDMWIYWSAMPAGVNSMTNEVYWTLYSTDADRTAFFGNWMSGNSLTLCFKQVRSAADPWWMCQGTAGVVSANSWYHFAFCRTASTDYFFKNGVAMSTVISYTTGVSAENVSCWTSGGFVRLFDRGNSIMPLRGIVDEFRIIKGVTVWTSNFTVPSEEYLSTEPGFVQNLLTPTITENDTSDVISIALSGMSWTVSAVQSLAGILLYDETTSNVIGYISYPTTMPADMPLVVTGVGIKVS